MKNLNELKHDHHFHVSVVKSAFRLMACGTLILAQTDGVAAAGLMLAIAELLGIGEELV
jgi:hypothetical protein